MNPQPMTASEIRLVEEFRKLSLGRRTKIIASVLEALGEQAVPASRLSEPSPAPVKKHRGSPCCRRRLIHLGNAHTDGGALRMHYECAGCGKAWRRGVDFRGLSEDHPDPIGPWQPGQLAQVIPLFSRAAVTPGEDGPQPAV